MAFSQPMQSMSSPSSSLTRLHYLDFGRVEQFLRMKLREHHQLDCEPAVVDRDSRDTYPAVVVEDDEAAWSASVAGPSPADVGRNHWRRRISRAKRSLAGRLQRAAAGCLGRAAVASDGDDSSKGEGATSRVGSDHQLRMVRLQQRCNNANSATISSITARVGRASASIDGGASLGTLSLRQTCSSSASLPASSMPTLWPYRSSRGGESGGVAVGRCEGVGGERDSSQVGGGIGEKSPGRERNGEGIVDTGLGRIRSRGVDTGGPSRSPTRSSHRRSRRVRAAREQKAEKNGAKVENYSLMPLERTPAPPPPPPSPKTAKTLTAITATSEAASTQPPRHHRRWNLPQSDPVQEAIRCHSMSSDSGSHALQENSAVPGEYSAALVIPASESATGSDQSSEGKARRRRIRAGLSRVLEARELPEEKAALIPAERTPSPTPPPTPPPPPRSSPKTGTTLMATTATPEAAPVPRQPRRRQNLPRSDLDQDEVPISLNASKASRRKGVRAKQSYEKSSASGGHQAQAAAVQSKLVNLTSEGVAWTDELATLKTDADLSRPGAAERVDRHPLPEDPLRDPPRSVALRRYVEYPLQPLLSYKTDKKGELHYSVVQLCQLCRKDVCPMCRRSLCAFCTGITCRECRILLHQLLEITRIEGPRSQVAVQSSVGQRPYCHACEKPLCLGCMDNLAMTLPSNERCGQHSTTGSVYEGTCPWCGRTICRDCRRSSCFACTKAFECACQSACPCNQRAAQSQAA